MTKKFSELMKNTNTQQQKSLAKLNFRHFEEYKMSK